VPNLTFHPRDRNTELLEKPLNVWIEDQNRKKNVLSILIRGKTKSHCEYFVSGLGYVSDAANFEASKGEFEKKMKCS